ncbi:hypothetical protein LAUMK4_03102 [Mycobacterium persicum]|uniref:Uncharacterized protein n=1 Tax=Mycobacterium persicum TaxID=1487726 RepID=A0AB38UUV1_9MYCO|nr:hypothetical protein LAUMK42_03155 [Mycobacterium persicum]VAZ95318.1 hypothetical protein LAUMK4_03102 [Mycobacterium persicum]
MSAPALPKPDALPVPELKKPDDGLAVEFPKPGAAGISMNVMSMGPKPLVMVMGIDVSGPPMRASTASPRPLSAGMDMVSKVMLR